VIEKKEKRCLFQMFGKDVTPVLAVLGMEKTMEVTSVRRKE